MSCRFLTLILAACLFAAGAQTCAQEPRYIIPQTALSPCPALARQSFEDVPPGTAIAVSADGRRMARYFHTIRGAEIALLDRDSAQATRVEIAPSQLPPGVTWQVTAVQFSPDGELLGVQTVGTVWVFSTATAEPLYEIGVDQEKQLYPAQMQMAGGRLLLAFWPLESLLAEADPQKPVETRLYEAATGKWQHTVFLPLRTPDAWTRIALSPTADRIAVLERATRWPGKARLTVVSAADATQVWRRNVGAEDLEWTLDAREVILFGNRLTWLDAANGKDLRESPNEVRFSEFQRLRINEAANAAAGFLMRYNPWKRMFATGQPSRPQFHLWRLGTGAPLCTLELDGSLRVEAWVTARGEIVALEETFDVRPQLRILRAARLVIYKLQQP